MSVRERERERASEEHSTALPLPLPLPVGTHLLHRRVVGVLLLCANHAVAVDVKLCVVVVVYVFGRSVCW
jgi:hypothetical protein